MSRIIRAKNKVSKITFKKKLSKRKDNFFFLSSRREIFKMVRNSKVLSLSHHFHKKHSLKMWENVVKCGKMSKINLVKIVFFYNKRRGELSNANANGGGRI